MESAIAQAARYLQQGQHVQAEGILEELQSDESCQSLEAALQALRQQTNGPQSSFTHFVALKLLRFCLIRNRSQWRDQKGETVQFLLEYAHALGDGVLSRSWKPVVAEWAATVAVVLKLGCVEDGVSPDAVHRVVSAVCSWVSAASGNASRLLLAWTVTQRTVEEFGLFDRSSRYRGLSLPTHRVCRERFEAPGQLSSVACQVFVSLLEIPNGPEAQMLAETGANAFLACLSWCSHRFFEEETGVEENCDVFTVDDPQWDALLCGGLSSSNGGAAPASVSTVSSLVRSWWQHGGRLQQHSAVGAVPPSLIAEILQQSCGFVGARWEASQQVQFFHEYLTLALDCLSSIHGSTPCAAPPPDEGMLRCLPSLVGAVSRLVGSREELLLLESSMPLVERLQAATVALIALETRCEDDEFVMSGLDELLSTWYRLSGLVQRGLTSSSSTAASRTEQGDVQVMVPGKSVQALHHLSGCCAALFQTYIQSKLSQQGESEADSNAFVETFSSSHLHFVAHIGRANVVQGCQTLSAALECLRARLTTNATNLDFCEQLWCVFKVTSFFVADPSEGEEPTIPLCFTRSTDTLLAVRDLLNAIVTCSGFYASALPSPAVFAAYVEVACSFVRVYIDPEEAPAAFVEVFGEVRTETVSFAMQLAVETLYRFPLDTDVMTAVCALLDALASHQSVLRHTLRTHPAYATLISYATQPAQYPLTGCTRGRLIAFLLACAEPGVSFQDVAHILRLFDIESVRVEHVLELTYALSGVFQSLRRQDILCALFPFFSGVTQRLLQVSYENFFERQIAIETVKLVRLIFTTSTPLVEDDRVRELLSMVLMTFRTCAVALRTVPAWHAAEAETDRVELLVALANLIASAAQWMKWDCYLPDGETVAFRSGSVECLADLFGFLNERSLALPDLEEASFSALKHCAESFPFEVTFSPSSSTFLSAILYSLHRARVSVQRVGMDVATCVTACLEAQSRNQENYTTTCREFLLTLLRGLASGGVFFANTRQLSGCVLTVARGTPQEAIGSCFEVVSRENPKSREVLEVIYTALIATLSETSPDSTSGSVSFEEVLRDSLSSLRGVTLT